jgi:hypothetical protein
MAYEQITYEVRDAVATITLNRPERLNAWTPQMGRELYDAFAAAGADDAARVIVVTGAGRGFCAGADMDNLRGSQSGAAGEAPSHEHDPLAAREIPPAHPALATSYAYPTSVPKPRPATGPLIARITRAHRVRSRALRHRVRAARPRRGARQLLDAAAARRHGERVRSLFLGPA